jgi:carbon-monoxide dehydrogenase medium subunit
MNLPEFVHFAPASLQEASALLLRYREKASLLAGGTDILVKMKHRRQVPRYLINIKKISGLDYLRCEDGVGLRIGPLTSIETLKDSLLVKQKYPVLHDAVSYLGTIEIRNRGTLAGNICNASPAAETVPALVLLGAQAVIAGAGAQRAVTVENFIAGPGRTVLQPGELVAEILIPEPAPGSAGAYDKFSLRRMDLAVVGAGVLLRMNGNSCADVQIVLSSVGPTPIRARSAEEVLRGRAPDDELIGRAGQAAAQDSRPQADFFGTVAYKKEAVAKLTVRVIKQALERAGNRGG